MGKRRNILVVALILILTFAGLFAGQAQVRAEEVPEPVAIVETVEDTQVDDAGVEEVALAIDEGVELVEEDVEVEEPEELIPEVDMAPAEAAPVAEEPIEAEELAVEELVEEPVALAAAPTEVVEEAVTEELATASPAPVLTYRTHVQNDGWQNYVTNGKMSGTQGRSLRLEGINIQLSENGASNRGSIQYRTHVQNIGWQGWKYNGEMSGTSGQALRLEAIQIKLTGDVANEYDVYYRVHCQNFGWMGWAKNGESSGSAGYAYRLEGIQIVLVPKGGSAPAGIFQNQTQATSAKFKDKNAPGMLNYRTHVQNEGWQDWVADGAMSGTQGKSYRLEGINIKLNGVAGGITYRTHVQNIGWQGWKSNGEMSGTSGQSLRLEAIQIKLTGDAANKYDVYYRVHCQNIGWMGWAKNGERSGTAGYGYRLEGINIKLIAKGAAAPGTTNNAFSPKNSSSAAGLKKVVDQAAWDEKVLVKEAWDEKVLVKEAWDEEIWGTRLYYWFSYAKERLDICRWDTTKKEWVVVDNKAELVKEVVTRLRSQGINDFSSSMYERALGEVIHHPAEYKVVHHPAEYKVVHHPEVYHYE